jgi:hypothetical protein
VPASLFASSLLERFVAISSKAFTFYDLSWFLLESPIEEIDNQVEMWLRVSKTGVFSLSGYSALRNICTFCLLQAINTNKGMATNNPHKHQFHPMKP